MCMRRVIVFFPMQVALITGFEEYIPRLITHETLDFSWQFPLLSRIAKLANPQFPTRKFLTVFSRVPLRSRYRSTRDATCRPQKAGEQLAAPRLGINRTTRFRDLFPRIFGWAYLAVFAFYKYLFARAGSFV